MKSNIKVRRVIKFFMLDKWNKITLEITCERVYIILLNSREQIINTLKPEEAEQTYQGLKYSC